jgi:hypothetical protein
MTINWASVAESNVAGFWMQAPSQTCQYRVVVEGAIAVCQKITRENVIHYGCQGEALIMGNRSK